MTARQIIVPGAMPSRDRNGRALAGKLRFYSPGTTTPATVYTSNALSVAHPFPLLSDSAGQWPTIWADDADSFDVAWSDQVFDKTMATYADVSPADDAVLASVALAEGYADAAAASAGLVGLWASIRTWATGTAYQVAAPTSVVTVGGKVYLCAIPHTSGVFATDLQNGKWTLAIRGGDPAGLPFAFSTTTTDADPDNGTIRLDNGTLASVAHLYVDNLEAGGGDITAWLDAFDDSSSSLKGQITLRDDVGTSWAIFSVTGPVVNGSGYRKIPVSYVSGPGGFANGATVLLSFARAGDLGLLPWSSVSGNATVASGAQVEVDTSGGPVTITLTPTSGATVKLKDSTGSWATHACTVVSAGGELFRSVSGGTGTPLVLNVDRALVELACKSDASEWGLVLTAGLQGETGARGAPGLQAPTKTPTFTAGAYTMLLVDRNKSLLCTTGATNCTVDIAALLTAEDGDMVEVVKDDSGAGTLSVYNGATLLATMTRANDFATFRYSGGVIKARARHIANQFQLVTSSVSVTPPPLWRAVFVELINAGNGGGSGRRGAAGSARFGGGGGGPGGINYRELRRAEIGDGPFTVTLASGGAGGAAVTVDSTDGNAGSAPGNSSFGTWVLAKAGGVGGAGTATTGSGGSAPSNTNMVGSVQAGASSSATAQPTAVSVGAVGAGGAGGGISTGNTAFAGGNGGQGSSNGPSPITGGTGGAATGANGNDGVSITDPETAFGGSGGGGGGGNASGAGGTGGKGGTPGGGGAGGGASVNGSNSGAGGQGGDARCRLTWKF